jgi:hypothetical protein
LFSVNLRDLKVVAEIIETLDKIRNSIGEIPILAAEEVNTFQPFIVTYLELVLDRYSDKRKRLSKAVPRRKIPPQLLFLQQSQMLSVSLRMVHMQLKAHFQVKPNPSPMS